jgi:hypothetical protein
MDNLHKLFLYDPDSGKCIRRVGRGNRAPIGEEISRKTKNGYLIVQVDRKNYLVHRLAWFLMTGEWPKEIDHINGVKTDNSWKNLREATRSMNMQNYRQAKRNNRSGFLGVRETDDMTFQARIHRDGVTLCLGTYSTAQEAYDTYVSAKRKIHPAGTL